MLIQIAIAAGTILTASARPARALPNASATPNDSTRTWLAAELRRMPGIVSLTGCRIDFPSSGAPAEPRSASRPWRDLPIVSIRASAEGHMVRLVAADSAMRVRDNPEVAGVARRLFSAGGIMLKASSEASAVRVASELNALSRECATGK